MDEIRFVGDLQRLDVRPGDRFVLKCRGYISRDMADRLEERLKVFLGPDAKVAVLCDGMELGIISSSPVNTIVNNHFDTSTPDTGRR